jgi:AraC-like DNA-binding protein
MNATAPSRPSALPWWSVRSVRDGRGGVDSGMFQHVHYVELFGGPQARARSKLLHELSGEAGFSHVVSTGHEIGLEEFRCSTLIFPLTGRLMCSTAERDIEARAGQALYLPPGRRRTRTIPEADTPFRAAVLILPEAFLAFGPDRAEAIALKDAPDLSAAARLLSTLCAPETDPVEAGRIVTCARTLVEGAFLAAWPNTKKERLALAPDHAVRRAEALLRERSCEEITINSIAREAGISLRQMQDLFRRTHGLSPHAYLTRLRLEQAHLHLMGKTPAPSVTEAALTAGFGHLGRFPQTYRNRFGRLPSQSRATQA